jgi:tetratricopeptide (TPR) repeat protein
LNFQRPISYIFTLAFAVLAHGVGYAQDEKLAEEAFESENYFEAIVQYEKLLETDPDNIDFNINLGLSYLRTNIDPKEALPYLLVAARDPKCPTYVYPELARAHMFHLEYEEALRNLEKFEAKGGVKRKNRDDFDRLVANCNAALDLLKYPVDVTFKNLGPEVNSEYADYHPFITKDGETILFTTRRKIRPGSKPEFDGYYPSDIFQTYFENGEWTTAKKLGDRINTIYDEQTVGLTQTGDSMFFYIDHVEDFGDIYMSVRQNNIYTNPVKLDTDINSTAIESSCSISKDGSILIFSSNRSGGYGGLDIWMIYKYESGLWGEPINLGPEINTPFDEDFPSLSLDASTLYFSSNGHPGMGAFDLYFSSWDSQSRVWTKPQNLGYPINGPSSEKTISFTGKGEKAVMTARFDDTIGDLDIYSLRYNKDIDDGPAIFLINIPSNEENPAAKIEIRNLFDEPIGEYLPNRITGRYHIALPTGKYFLSVDAEGFVPYNEVLVISDFHKRQLQNVKLITLEQL